MSRSSVAPGMDDAKYTLASSLLATMMREVIIDHALMAHKNIIRLKKAQGILPGGCPVCKSTCQASPLESGHAARQSNGIPKEGSVKEEEENASTNETTATQPKGLEIYHNNPLLSCIICSRQVSANRYAQHLASCVGVGKGGIARRKGKPTGNAKIKTALENRKRAGFLMSGASTPLQRATPIQDDGASVVSDDEFVKRSKSNLSHSFTKRSTSPAVIENSDSKKLRTEDGPSRTQSLLGVSALASSQPTTGSPLNPLRHSKTITIDSDEDEEEDEEEGAISLSQDQKSTNAPQSSSVLSGEEGSEFAGDDSGSDEDNESEDGSYQEGGKRRRSETASLQSEAEDDF